MKKAYVITAGMLGLAAVYCFRGVELTAAAVPVFLGLLVMAAYMSVRRMRGACVMAYGAVSASFWLASPWIQPAMSTRVILAVLTCAAGYSLHKSMSKPEMLAYRQKGMMALIALASLYASFASFGYRLFLSGTRMTLSVGRFANLLMGAIWFYPVIMLLLSLLERWGFNAQQAEVAKKPSRTVIGRVSALIALVCLTIGFIGFYPGGYPVDSIVQLIQANANAYHNWHPVIHTLIIKLISSVFGNPSAVVYVQLIMLAILVGKAAQIAYDCGVCSGSIYLSVVLFSLLPNQIMSNIGMLKDYMFTYSLIWGTILLFEFALCMDEDIQPAWMIQSVLCMYFMKELRHNGILPLLFMVVALLVAAVRNKRKNRIRVGACVIAAFALIGFTDGPVFKGMNVIPNPVSPYVTMFCGVGSCVNKGKTFSDETTEQLEKVMSLEEWAQHYGRFSGHDPYLFRNGINQGLNFQGESISDAMENHFAALVRQMDLTGFSASEAFRIYFEALLRYPDIVIKDRLDGMNIMWDVTQPDDEDSFNERYYDMGLVYSAVGLTVKDMQDGSVYYAQNPISRFYRSWASFAFDGERREDQIADMLLWRSGAYLIFFAVLVIYWTKHRLHRMWWAAAPMLGNIAAMVLVLYHQSFRYVYFIQLCVLLLTVMTIRMQRQYVEKANSR